MTEIHTFLARYGLKGVPEQPLHCITSELDEVSKEELKATDVGRSGTKTRAGRKGDIGSGR